MATATHPHLHPLLNQPTQLYSDGSLGADRLTFMAEFYLPQPTPMEVLHYAYLTPGDNPFEDVEVYSEQHKCNYLDPIKTNELIVKSNFQKHSNTLGVAPRDMLTDYVWNDLGGECYMFAMRSCHHEKRPINKKWVRIDVIYYGLLVQPGDDGKGAKVSIISTINYGDQLPDSIGNVISAKKFLASVVGYKKFFQNRETSGADWHDELPCNPVDDILKVSKDEEVGTNGGESVDEGEGEVESEGERRAMS